MFARAAFAAVVAAAAAFLPFAVRRGAETDLLSLAGIGRGHGLREASDAMSGTSVVLFEGRDAEAVRESAAAAVSEFGGLFYHNLGEVVRSIGEHGAGLLSDDTRALLESGAYDEVMQASLSRLFGPVPPMVSPRIDPFLLCSDYFESLWSTQAHGWSQRDGYLHKRIGDTEYAAVALQSDRVSQRRLCELKREGEGPAKDGVKMWCAGPAFHTAVATANSRREINVLSALSAIAVLLVGFALFRSFRFAPVLVAAQVSAFAVATAALFVVFGRPHVITFIFGTSLIGLSVDYVYHSLAESQSGRRAVMKPLTFSMLTTVCGFLPLVFAPVPALRQMALFSAAGISTVYAFVVLFVLLRRATAMTPPLHHDGGAPAVAQPSHSDGAEPVRAGDVAMASSHCAAPGRRIGTRFGKGMFAVFSALCACAVFKAEMSDDPSSFYRPDPYLAAGDRLFVETAGEFSGRMAITRGATLQEALENEERAGVRGVSAIVPSLKRQRENAALKAKLYAVKGAEYAQATGMAVKGFDASSLGDDAFVDAEKVPELAWMAKRWNGRSTATPVSADFRCGDPAVKVYSVREALELVVAGLTVDVMRLLGWSMLAMAILFAVLFRRRAPIYAFPICVGICSAIAALVATGTPVTVFSVIAIFVVAGLGVDYTVFYRSQDFALPDEAADAAHGEAAPSPLLVSTMRRTVFYSFLTSFIGLGALAFTQFPVTRSMGIAFAGGLLGAYLAARVGAGNGGDPVAASEPRGGCGGGSPPPGVAWASQKEQSAGRFRIALMWWIYRIFGKTVQKIVFVPAMFFIYPFCIPARRALRQFYGVLAEWSGRPARPRLFRHLLGFAWSLMDKTDACTLKKDLPSMSVRDDEGWRAFRGLVADGKGAFVMSSHVGTLEVLPALAYADASVRGTARTPFVHAFQQMTHNSVFTEAFMRHFDHSSMELHAVEEIGAETACEMQDAIRGGGLVVMAGDRLSAGSKATLRHRFMGRECLWPKGVFVFAKLMEAPVFFATCVRTGWNSYEAHFERYCGDPSDGAAMLSAYVSFLEREVSLHPGQWYHFHEFFANVV